jgi:cell division protein FtsI/penicillin-binding protein 2
MPQPPQYNRYRAQPQRRNPWTRALAVLFALIALCAVPIAAYLIVKGSKDEGPRPALDDFLSKWSSGDDRGASKLTDRPSVALAALVANRKGLDGATLQATSTFVKDAGDSGRAGVAMAWKVPGIGRFAYDTRIEMHKIDGHWKVLWVPSVVHPLLDATNTRLGTVRAVVGRGAILDRNGAKLVSTTPVIRVGAVVNRVKDPAKTATGLARVLAVDAKAIQRQIENGGPQQFVEAIALREPDYARLRPALKKIQGVTSLHGEAELAPSRTFGRAVLGTVGPVTAEQVKKTPSLAGREEVGQWGLEAAYDRRLAGAPERRIVIREDGAPIRRLLRKRGKAGHSLTTTLDKNVQAAAEKALGGVPGNAALVAMQPSTGDLLAVANRPSDSSFDRALAGNYAPGSTFKVVVTAALLRTGLGVTTPVACPKTETVGGRPFKNFQGETASGSVPFSQDFAISCNTAFVSLYNRISPKALSRVARDYGLGRKVKLRLGVAQSSVPPPSGDTARAAAMIGQDKIVASPLAMAGVAATVAAGKWHSPRIVDSDASKTGPDLALGEVSSLRTLMRGVVTGGTGTALANLGGSPAGKSGTAEFGNANPPATHAWFIAFRGDLAVAVLVEKGKSGGSVAAPIVARFLAAVP